MKRIKYLLLFLSICLLFACGSEANQEEYTPAPYLPELELPHVDPHVPDTPETTEVEEYEEYEPEEYEYEEYIPTPLFLYSGFELSEFNTYYDFAAMSFVNFDAVPVGSLYASLYITEGNDLHEPHEGYEWRIIHFTIEFDDDYARSYSAVWAMLNECFYYFDLEKIAEQASPDDDGMFRFTRIFHGEEINIMQRPPLIIVEGWIDGVLIFEQMISFLVPIGYDGLLVAFFNPLNVIQMESDAIVTVADLVDENTIWFRLAE